jgi:hypothetical protein
MKNIHNIFFKNYTLLIILVIVSSIVSSCNLKPEPCKCVEAYLSQDKKYLSQCTEHFESLAESQKEDWLKAVKTCDPSNESSNSGSQSNNDNTSQYQSEQSVELPAEIQAKIDRVNQINENYNSTPDAYDIYSIQALSIARQKIQLLESMIVLINELENSGYKDRIPDFDAFKAGVRLKYTGLKMQIEGLEEMQSNGTIN